MRIAIGGLMHESNTFNPLRTDRTAFSIQTGDEILTIWRAAHHEMGGFIAGAEQFGYTLHPTIMAWATPAGPVTDEMLDWWTAELLTRLQQAPSLDGLLLALHGAMVVESFQDGDGEVVRRLRAALGREFPIVVTHDYHANVSELLVAESTALIIYKTCPHVDQRQIGLQAAHLITRIVHGEIQPTQALAKPPMLLNIRFHNTSLPPMQPIMDAARALEQEERVLAASVAAGYQYADVFEMGPSAVVVTDNDPERAQQEAERLGNLLWHMRERLVFTLPEAREAVQIAMAEAHTAHKPIILVEMGDNIGGGSAGDSTIILEELLRQQAQGWVVVLTDPEAVKECVEAGIGTEIRLRVGGKTDQWHGTPVDVDGRVRSLHDGRYEEREPRHGGKRFHDQGMTAVLEIADPRGVANSYLVLTSKREPPFSLQQILSVGITPAYQKILVVKAAVAFRAAYEPIAGPIIEVDTPGLTAVNPQRFTYRYVRRPLWGLED